MSKEARSVLPIALPLILVLVGSFYLQSAILSNQTQVTLFLERFGPLVILLYIVLQSITVIIAPLGGFVLVLAMITLFGPFIALSLAYLVTTPLYMLNFYLARRYGRPLVAKLMGKHALKTVDHFAKDAGNLTLIILRVFQGGSFDYISYGAGLTTIPFKTFAVVTILGGIPAGIISYVVFSKFSNLTSAIIAYYIISYILVGISFAINYYLLKKRQKN